MKGRLIKNTSELGYALVIQPCPISNNLKELAKLSRKNCQVIENGYDLEDMAKYFAYNQSICDVPEDYTRFAYTEGFLAALKILGDKKFSEEDIRESYSRGQTNSPIQSLQQTEWDVEIEMNRFFKNDYDGKIVDTNPKLDSDGCLILKRI